MQIDAHIRHSVDKAREISESYETYVLSPCFPRSADLLIWILQQYLNLKIQLNVLEIPAQGNSIRALIAVSEGHFEIYLLGGMPHDLHRVVVCKELFHAVLDSEDYRNMALYKHLSECVMPSPDECRDPSPAKISEIMAEVAAMEFLFPYRERVTCKKLIAAGKLNFERIAEEYMIPQFLVERYMSEEWLQYMSMLLNDEAEPEESASSFANA